MTIICVSSRVRRRTCAAPCRKDAALVFIRSHEGGRENRFAHASRAILQRGAFAGGSGVNVLSHFDEKASARWRVSRHASVQDGISIASTARSASDSLPSESREALRGTLTAQRQPCEMRVPARGHNLSTNVARNGTSNRWAMRSLAPLIQMRAGHNAQMMLD